ncbi:response regulator [Streptomyces sp. Li-HN-5-11]|uniref:response regulator n=1 Tax=Streptomyces sp. Li-HN-5-11 TaxID=3075432 RepID=UPI0028A80613|nr:response regulator [Streptomyces sp. Li-HN-5-11]WNM36535.1 response regulator [Streptomyces sp. Li-HN-5-11]
MTDTFRVLIVEDDAVIARVYSTLVGAMPSFTVVGTARTAADGLTKVRQSEPHLVLLDYGLPGGASGVDLLRKIRSSGSRVEVLAITAHSSTDLVRESMRLGVLDYLVKPFSEERLRQALNQFISISAQVRATALAQKDVDRLRESSAPVKQWIPRELSGDRLEVVRDLLNQFDGPRSAEEVAEQLDSSRVTARRYLEFLVSLREAEVTVDADKPGRPRKLYAIRPRPGSR